MVSRAFRQGRGRNGGAISLTRIEKSSSKIDRIYNQMREMQAVVRVMCGYSSEEIDAMSWRELARSYNDCIRVRELFGER